MIIAYITLPLSYYKNQCYHTVGKASGKRRERHLDPPNESQIFPVQNLYYGASVTDRITDKPLNKGLLLKISSNGYKIPVDASLFIVYTYEQERTQVEKTGTHS